MPMQTWSRSTASKLNRISDYKDKVTPLTHNPAVGYTGLNSALQITTSFRTRGDQSHLDVPDTPLELFRSSNMDLSDDDVDGLHLPPSKGYAGRDTGHPFSTQRNTIGLSHSNVILRGSQGSFWAGPIRVPLGADFPVIPPIQSNLYGSRAIAATVPTKSVGGLSVALGELLRDGFPRLGIISLPEKVADFRKLGDDYLNVEFGWKPFLKDVQNLAYAVINSSRILSQYQRDSGHVVRRRFSFPAVETSKLISSELNWALDGSPGIYSGNNDLYLQNPDFPTYAPGKGRRDVVLDTYEKYVFSGAYSYYLAPDDSVWSRVVRAGQLAEKLVGPGLTPAALWNLAPWSWLVDWVSDVGSIVTNASALASDGLVIRWGYLQRHSVYSYKTTIIGIKFYDGPRGPFSATYRSNRKERVKATPFGFGLDTNSFTTRQWAILAALGITKAPRIAF